MREAGSSRAGRPGTTLPGAQKRADVGVSFERRKKKTEREFWEPCDETCARAILAARACRHLARGAEASALLKFRASSASASRWRLRNNSVNPVGRHGGGNGDWRAAPRPLAGDLAEAPAGGRGAAWPAVLSGNKKTMRLHAVNGVINVPAAKQKNRKTPPEHRGRERSSLVTGERGERVGRESASHSR